MRIHADPGPQHWFPAFATNEDIVMQLHQRSPSSFKPEVFTVLVADEKLALTSLIGASESGGGGQGELQLGWAGGG
jgi:hypothetical protein